MGLIDTKVGEFTIGEAVGIGLAKSFSENLLSGIIGNGTFKSGAIKVAGAWGIPVALRKLGIMKGTGKITKIIATAVVVDGVEDMVNQLFKGGSTAQTTSGLI